MYGWCRVNRMWQRFGTMRARLFEARPPKRRADDVASYRLYQDVQQDLRNTVPIRRGRWQQQSDFSYLTPLIDAAKAEACRTERAGKLSGAQAWAWLRALVLQAPRAAEAQQQMDKFPHGYHNKSARLYELIDFNDAFVSTVLALPAAELPHFAVEAKRLMDWLCTRVGSRRFSDEQYQGIVQGLGREIAVYRGAQQEGFVVHMTERTKDALGIDMVITDPASGRFVNIDCKAPSSYRHRIYKLLHEKRLTQNELEAAESLGFIAEMNGRGRERAEVIVWRITREEYGDITAFSFLDTTQLGKKIHAILDIYGQTAPPAAHGGMRVRGVHNERKAQGREYYGRTSAAPTGQTAQDY